MLFSVHIFLNNFLVRTFVNPQQLLQLIEQQLQLGLKLTNSSTDRAPEISFAEVTRRIARQLESQREAVSPPMPPLPSAECLAAFAERNSTPSEDDRIVASCIHDMGILFQLVNIVDHRLSNPVVAVRPEVMARLLSLGPRRATQSHDAEPPIKIEDKAVQCKTSRKVAVEQWIEVNHTKDSINKSLTRPWLRLGAAILAASAIFIAYLVVSLMQDNRQPTRDQLSKSTENHGNLAQPSEPIPQEAVTPTNSTENPQIAEQKSAPKLAKPDMSEIAAEPNDSSATSNQLTLDPLPREEIVAPRESPSVSQPAKFGHWEQVVGILASSPDRSYPTWQVVSESKRKELTVEAQSLTWMTPPGCYAQAAFGDQGKLLLRENSVASFRMLEEEAGVLPVLELEYGGISIAGARSKHSLQLRALSTTTVRLELDESASLLAWTENGELRLLPQGNVVANGQKLVGKRVVRIFEDSLNVTQETLEEPGWCRQLPKENVLSKGILGNLDQSKDLAKSVDQELSRLLARPTTMLSRKQIQQLAYWRVAMDSDSPIRSALSPIPAVRVALFNILLNDTTEMRFLAARRSLLGRLQLEDGLKRTQIVNRQSQPTRRDIAAWLNELTGDDLELAAFADYMLRTQVTIGPAFDPTAPRAQREFFKREWTRAITGR